MHIEKNIVDSILGTLWNIPAKTKDHAKARFHIRKLDARLKTQNSGVTVVASTTSFASSKDMNPIAADLTYYGRIVDIVELDYYSDFKVELQNCQNFGETTDDAFTAVFGKEQPGRLRCYGRSVKTSSLKKDDETNKLKPKHANEITSLKEVMNEMRKEMRHFFSQLL
ncbi:hypothetical protein RDI58_014949 [Solanum bulbocastanum]|uniref:Uncharacterized protein n=1 Tax=Solanum bulbocastanum TaxID=147425 RepID=A0AAN8TGV5_SOLBU